MKKLIGYVEVDSGTIGLGDLAGGYQLGFSTAVGDSIFPVFVDDTGEYPRVVIDLDPMAYANVKFHKYVDDLAVDIPDPRMDDDYIKKMQQELLNS